MSKSDHFVNLSANPIAAKPSRSSPIGVLSKRGSRQNQEGTLVQTTKGRHPSHVCPLPVGFNRSQLMTNVNVVVLVIEDVTESCPVTVMV
jgi:hypothetical protein